MFTGIVERTGVVETAVDTGGGLALRIGVMVDSSHEPWRDAELGESIGVNGVCLTVVDFDNGEDSAAVSFEVVPESLEKTALGALRAGDAVNIERSLRAGDSFGGHYVTGHVDGTGEVVEMERQGDQVLFRISTLPGLTDQMLDKGSIAVDGVSLTIVEVDRVEGWFSFAAIPHTLAWTTLGALPAGHTVNIETDAFGKWALHGLRIGNGQPGGQEGQ